MNPIYLTDRSRIDSREECERKRFLTYDFDVNGEPLGIQRRTASLPLLNGTVLHEAHARVLGGMPVNDVAALIISDYRTDVEKRGVHGELNLEGLIREQSALIQAMLRAFVLTWMPRILEEYDVVSIEKPMDWALAPGLVQKLRFDTVLRRKSDQQLIILDYKSMAYLSDAWEKKLERSRQTSLYVSAAEELFGEPVEMAYLGIVKGAWRKDTARSSPFFEQKIQSSPLLYAYALRGEVGNVYQTAYTKNKGWAKIRAYDEMSIEEWVDWLWHHERETLDSLFVFNPPFSPTPVERARVRELVVREELEYVADLRQYRAMKALGDAGNEVMARKAQDFLDYVLAPMRENSCFKYGAGDNKCSFHDGICFNDGGLERALEDGEYEVREPHHNTELEVAA